MKIEPASPKDRDTTIALWEAAGLTRSWNDPGADFEKALANPTSDVLLAREGGDLLGSVMVGFDGHRGWVYYVAVDPALQRRDIGRALMAEAEQLLIERGCPKLNLQVRAGNDAVLAFYASLGYVHDHSVSLGKRLIADT